MTELDIVVEGVRIQGSGALESSSLWTLLYDFGQRRKLEAKISLLYFIVRFSIF